MSVELCPEILRASVQFMGSLTSASPSRLKSQILSSKRAISREKEITEKLKTWSARISDEYIEVSA
jgi:hypothetical protein